jgi:hypothetical protein
VECRNCGRQTWERHLCPRGTGCRAFIGRARDEYRSSAPDCPGCDSAAAVVLFRPAGVPWYGGPYRQRLWRCVACQVNYSDPDGLGQAVG